MGSVDLLQLAAQFGTSGAFVAYLIWREHADRKQRAADHAERIELDKETNEERSKLTTALTTLSIVVQGRANV